MGGEGIENDGVLFDVQNEKFLIPGNVMYSVLGFKTFENVFLKIS